METDAKALVTVGLRKTFESTDDDRSPSEPSGGWTSRSIAVSSWPSWAPRDAASRPAQPHRRPRHADRRQVEIDGEPITGLSEDDLAMMRRRQSGSCSSLQPPRRHDGLENVAMPAAVAGRSRKQAETRGRDLLDLLGIADKASAAPGRLSGGQRQRLSIARALANEPTLLLADEPTGSLDSAGGAEVLELFRRLHEGGQTIVMVTHDDDVASVSDRIGAAGRPYRRRREHAATGAAGGVSPRGRNRPRERRHHERARSTAIAYGIPHRRHLLVGVAARCRSLRSRRGAGEYRLRALPGAYERARGHSAAERPSRT